MGGFGDAIYDSKNQTVLGRSCSSWLKILVFYSIYYVFLALLFWGSVQAGLLRVSYVDVVDKNNATQTKPVGTPPSRSRTSQPGMDVWPQQLNQENDKTGDDEGRGFPLEPLDDDSLKLDENGEIKHIYARYTLQFLKQYCPKKDDCWFTTKFGEQSTWKSQFGVDFLKFDAKGNTILDNAKFKANVCSNSTTAKIDRPLFFIRLNRVIRFEIKGVGILNNLKGVEWQHEDPKLNITQMRKSVLFNCFVKDNTLKKIPGNNTMTMQNLDAKADIQFKSILPYISNDDYAFNGYKAGKDAENKQTINQPKPFAVFRVESKNDFVNKQTLRFRCNAIADNIEYAHLQDDALMNNPVLMQSGNGHIEFGFDTKPRLVSD